MKQLIARIPEDLHQRLKARAAVEGRSLNALVIELLQQGGPLDERALVRARARALGMLVEPTPEGPVLPLDEVIERTRGWGTAVSDALIADRWRR